MNFTPEQQKAIAGRGNTLVLAGAGSGKTRTLVERCAQVLLDEEKRVSVRNVLVVTFNDAAAAEVRERLRKRLEQAAPNQPRAREQLAQIDTAQVSTLHSFCFTLLREHFYELDLDPGVAVLDETQAYVLFLKTFQELLYEHYAGLHPFSGELKEFIRAHFNGWDRPLREFVQKLHEFTQTRPDPEGWFSRQLALLEEDNCASWSEWYRGAVQEWCAWWLPWLRQLPLENENAHQCANLLEGALKTGGAGVFAALLMRDQLWPKNRKIAHRKPFAALFEEAEFLASLQSSVATHKTPLQEDWEWARPALRILLLLAQQFAARFAQAKHERSVLDFHDLEQGALKLLWNEDRPSRIAELWRRRFHAVFVDEYQDINQAQDRIISAISGGILPGNRFLVGDNKQSIYRFRQANPAIFQQYLSATGDWDKAFLRENFRSHEGILNFINSLFEWLMRKEVGGVDYDDSARLIFGGTLERTGLRATSPAERQVELNVIFTDAEVEGENEDGTRGWDDLEKTEREARMVAARLRELRQKETEIVDAATGERRRVEWRDMVVLLRSAAGKLEIYSKAFEAFGVPLHTKQNAFYTTQEVLDLSNLLRLLDNPLQDIPLVSVLRSPLCGLTANELARIRIASKARPFWRALTEFNESKLELAGREKVERFLARFHAWRGSHSCASLAQRLERILADTGYDEWLLTQPRGQQRYANVQQLLRIARRFDESRGESLYLFLAHIEEMQAAVGDIEPAIATHENAVRLMTVHQSKGLEFPIVVAPDLGKPFNFGDQRSGLIIHEKFGLCTMIKPPHKGHRYPSLPLWLARREERIATLGEEIRLMYVAFTRAQNRLLLFGNTSEKRARSNWNANAVENPMAHHLLKAGSWLDWIGTWVTNTTPDWLDKDRGMLPLMECALHRGPVGIEKGELPPPRTEIAESKIVSTQRLDYSYPNAAATHEVAKTSVSALRNRGEEDEEARLMVFRKTGKSKGRKRGLASHAFLENLDLARLSDLKAQAAEMAKCGALRDDEVQLIDFESLTEFWNSSAGREILSAREFVQRELPFTCKLTADALKSGLALSLVLPKEEFILIQGIVDLAVIKKDEIWILDFKTDELTAAEVPQTVESYRLQLTLYSFALAAIYKRPVTKKGFYFVQPRRLEWL